MKIKLKNTPEQVELIKAMASTNTVEAMKAREAFAGFIKPVILQVLNFLPTSNLIYTVMPFDENDNPEIPLDMYYGQGVNTVQVWSQTMAGGTATSEQTGLQTMKLNTYPLEIAWSLTERNIQKGRLPVVGLALNRATNELAVKIDLNAWNVALKALAEASTNSLSHVISSNTAGRLLPADFNALKVRTKRINTAFNGGTPDGMYSRGLSDIFASPEMLAEIRSWAYNPISTTATPNTDESTAFGLPDDIRSEIYRAAGTNSIFGVNITEMLEFGTGTTYNVIFDNWYTSTFSAATQQVLVGVDASREALIRPTIMGGDGTELSVQVDDSFSKRSGKVGFWGKVNHGSVCVDARCLTAIIT